METEQIYGESFLRWIYGTTSGRLALHAVAKRAFFSQFYGWRMNAARSAAMVAPFLARYGLDPQEFVEPAGGYASFNDFFYRRLAPGARPIEADPDVVTFPADGRHLAVPDVSAMKHFFVKGQQFDLAALLGSPSLAERYAHGALVLSRLCPVDYHRYHFPLTGVAGRPRLIPGPLFSVNPIALRQRLAYLWENKRVITEVRSQRFGTVQVLEIGATNVGSIVQTFRPESVVGKGAEKGYFEFGGSSVITLFEPGRLRLVEDLAHHSGLGTELYAKMGTRLGWRA
jgi:phosphatidylserine decarboxylase